MCGIAGFFARDQKAGLSQITQAMGDAIHYRGPDTGACWVSAQHGIGLAHRRLAIVDLTEAGAQPMHSSCGRFVIVYNGEVYNAPEIRRDLEAKGRRFRGHSDTEVIIEGISEWGLADLVPRLIGMFAFAVWDRKLHVLSLVRDRLGIKPVYWANFGNMFIFGSELKALRAAPGWTAELDRDSITSYFRHNYIPAPFSIYKNVRKLQPGAILSVSASSDPRIETFWDLDTVVEKGLASRPAMELRDDNSVIDELDSLLSDAVMRRMISDVPFGAFLSGGIDSSVVAALMQKSGGAPVRTFSIGFHETEYNEADRAKAIAQHLGTEHTELYVSPRDALAVIPKLQSIYDEPFADSSQIPTYLVSQMTRRHVTVALSGDGGDELFAGYNRYYAGEAMQRNLDRVPMVLRHLAARAIRGISPQAWDSLAQSFSCIKRIPYFGDRAHKLAAVLNASETELYLRLISHWTDPSSLIPGGKERPTIFSDPSLSTRIPDYMDRMQYLDTKNYLPDDILTKVDRASMAVSLEARVPLLDHRVVEFSWSLPRKFKIRHGRNKWILREVLKRYVPESLFDRPKMGFGIALDRWLRGSLREWAEDLLSENSLQDSGLEAAPIRALWDDHLSGRRNWQYHLWDVLMFQAWRRGANVS